MVAPTHKVSIRVSDGTNTQVVAWTIDKWRAKIIQREIYNVRDPEERGIRERKKNTVAIRN